MAKDGTMRGGMRYGSGQKKKELTERIMEGKHNSKVLSLPDIADPPAVDMPPRSYLSDVQKDGIKLEAVEIRNETWEWLKARGCAHLIYPHLVDKYAMHMARWIHLQRLISKYGYVGKHPTTDNPMPSIFVREAQDESKEVNASWFMIFQIVKENCSVPYVGNTPYEDSMERLLSYRTSKGG